MKPLLIYLKVIYKETVIVITGVTGFILACILPVFPVFKGLDSLLFGGVIVAICFLLANISAIIKLAKKNTSQAEEIVQLKKTSVDFKLDITPKEYFYDEKEKYIKEEIAWVLQQIKDINDIKNPRYSGSVNMGYLDLNLKNMLLPSEAKIKDYLEELQRIKSIIDDLKKNRFFNLNVSVKNTGTQYEEDIIASIKTKEGDFEFLYEMPLYDLKDLPARPVGTLMSNLTQNFSFPSLNASEKPVNRMFIQTKKILKITLAKLHVGHEVELFSNMIFLEVHKEKKELVFDIEVVSLNTRSPYKITKEIKL